jgi:hypothetical protein
MIRLNKKVNDDIKKRIGRISYLLVYFTVATRPF